MLKNYGKTALRNFVRNKFFSLINITGLALGLASSLLLFLWIQDELNKDTFHKNSAFLYNVYERVFSEGKVEAARWTPGMLASELKLNIPEIEYSTGFSNNDLEGLFSIGDKNITMVGRYGDSSFFKMFSYDLLEGTPGSALSGPEDIAISKKMAENCFGSAQAAYGKSIRYNNSTDLRISAIFDNVPSTSSQKFDFLLNWSYLLKTTTWLKEWIYRGPYTFIQLRPDADPVKVESKIKTFLAPYVQHSDGAGFHLELGLQRYDKMYLNGDFKNGAPNGGRIEYVRLFTAIAIFILLIACINFMNLATARSVKRAKEVGIRKTAGAYRSILVIQFLSEAMLLACLSVVLALAIVSAVLPYFNGLAYKQMVLPLTAPYFWIGISAMLCFTGILSGSYPAFYLSSLHPVKVLKGSHKVGSNALLFRKGLVVFQFALSIILIVVTLIMSQQIHFVANKNLGFDKESLIYIPFQGDLDKKYSVFRQRLATLPGIKAVSRMDQPPSYTGAHAYDMEWEGKDPDTKTVVIHVTVGYGFLKLMNLTLLQGRDFSEDFPSDLTTDSTSSYIINETAVKMIGYKDPIGRPLGIFRHHGKIVGVVKDFNFKSLREPIEPLLINLDERTNWGGGYVLIKTEPGKTQEALAGAQKLFNEIEPRFPFRYSFADEEYQKLYDNEQTISTLTHYFSFLAIFISCLGLLGLSMFTAEQRTKEIGVRKVIGASVGNIVTLLSKDIVKLVILSAVIASPVSWFFMNNWLQEYAYRIEIGSSVFLLAGAMAILIALITISFQAIKAALTNPIRSLRSE